jgi:hypothetical protein
LSRRIADASQNHRHNPQYPEIPQSKSAHIFFFLRQSCRDDWPFTSGVTRRSDSECAIESRIGSQLH